MKQYLDITKNILYYGQPKPNRTGTDTILLPFQHFQHDMNDGFPLLTTKKMAFKSICVELEGFIKGITSKKWYQERDCHVWDEWANPMTPICNNVPLRSWPSSMWTNMCGPQCEEDILQYPNCKTIQDVNKYVHDQEQRECDDLGPIYGYQWRHFGACYDENDNGPVDGYDQLKNIIKTLKTNPNNRRMVCSAWNPNQLNRMALPPCIFTWGLVYNFDEKLNEILNLWFISRSCDWGIGGPWNIASYALLLLLICHEVNMNPGLLSGFFADCHIYENHIEQLKLQLKREPFTLPSVKIINNKSIFNWTHKDVELINYQHHSMIKLPIAV